MNRSYALALAFLFVCPMVVADSLFETQNYRPLAVDRRAKSVGDVLTVVINENATASANSAAATDTNVDVSVAASDGVNEVGGKLGAGSKFDGGGSIRRGGAFQARVAVVVASVFPNGDLWVKGEQLIEFNEERQHIAIEGRVRREDVSAGNTVLSERLAESKISYKGEGVLSKSESPGVITRFFNWLF
jgi:flagellar L-ring protein precursor FlgH